MYEKLSYTNSDELCEQMAAECDTVILSFSCGKDSVASWLQCRKYFKYIVPVYLYFVPDLDFVEDNLKYYEDFFGQHIYRMASPEYYRMAREGVFQSKERWDAICRLMEMIPTEKFTKYVFMDHIRKIGNLPPQAYCAIGNRAADSPMRRMNISKNGCVNHNKKQFYPVYDWSDRRVVEEIKSAGCKLATDYQLWNNTFDSLSYKYLSKIREVFPEDYKKIITAYPMAVLEFMRRGEEI